MNKKLSRIAAIALSAAMVTSAFAMSTSASFAATTPTITTTAVDKAVTYGGAANTFTLPTSIAKGATIDIGDNTKDVAVTANDVDTVTDGNQYNWVSSDTTVATADNTGKVTVKKANKEVTFTTYGTADFGTIETGKHNNTEAYKATNVKMTVHVYVYADGAAVVLPGVKADVIANAAGTYVDSDTAASFNETKHYGVYTVKGGTDALATYAAATEKYSFASNNSDIQFTGKVTTVDEAAAADGTDVLAQPATAVKTGKATISAYKTGDKTATAVPATLTVENSYTLSDNATFEGVKKFGYETVTNNTTAKDGYNLTNVAIKTAGKNLTVDNGAIVGAVTDNSAAPTSTVTLTDGTVASITGAAAVTTAIDTGAATKAAAPVVKTGDISATAVTVAGATVKAKDENYGTINLGNVKATTLGVTTSQDSNKAAEGLVTIGNVTASGAVTVTTTPDAKTLTMGTISGTQGAFADCPYDASLTLAAGKFTTGDLKYIGRVEVKANTELTAGAISTGTVGKNPGPDACGDNSADTSVVTVNGKLTAKSIYTYAAPTGAGTIVLPASSFTIATDTAVASTGLTLNVTNATVGSVLYTTNFASPEAFKMNGITAVESKNTGKNVYDYVVKTAELQGIILDNNNISVGNGSSAVVKATTVPNLPLPAGVTVSWSASKTSVALTPSADTMSCSIKSTGYTDANINGSNNVVVTATLVNKDGTVYKPFGTTLSSQDCQVTLTSAVAPVLTTTVTDLDGKTQTVTADTVIKMTQSTYNTVNFAADKAGIADIKYGTGDGAKAQTGTTSAWNGTAGKYTIYASGKVGDKVGVFANGVKVFQIEIVDRPFKCDTTLDLDGVKGKALTVGQKYSFKIYDATTAIKDFTFLTANDSAVASWGFVKNADGTVTATIKALKATDKIGVYAKINGVTYKVFAAAVK